ncbi:MAG: sulfoxide reductase heme-binding subunit YedZ [Pyrinomonadaceae bacterium]|nr:sulfoxide reductase heme-binding subunit YedZ [Pyrinomonadaceae bacterium]
MSDVRFYKTLLWLNSLVPVTILGWDAWNHRLGANPIEYFLRATGIMTLVFILATMLITPLRKWFGWNQLIKYRRTVGLFAFFYGLIHFTTYIAFDRSLDLAGTVDDVIQRPFIALGMAALLMMVPLAVTSTNAMIKRMGGKRWQMLHRLIYLSAAAGVVHFWMIVKSDVFYPAIFAAVLLVMLGVRAYFALQGRKTASAKA